LIHGFGFATPGLLLAAWLGAQGGPGVTLLWGGDAEGGAPFVEADPADASQVRGFDVEVAETIARGLGRHARFVQVQWSSIDQSVERGDFAIGLSGVEDTPARRAHHAVTVPYFSFREVLAVRSEDRGPTRTSSPVVSTPSCWTTSSRSAPFAGGRGPGS